MRVYYFGFWDHYGYYLKDHTGKILSYSNNGLPWKQLNGVLCPDDTRKEGIVKIHHLKGWTAAAFWDCSIDSRPGSNSVLFVEDLIDINKIISEFKEIFPNIYKRFDFDLVEWLQEQSTK